jgi:cell division protein FtsX
MKHLSDQYVKKVEDVVNVGDKVKVEIIEIGEKLSTICNDSPIIDWSSEEWTDDIVIPKHENFKYVSPDEHFEIFKDKYANQPWLDAFTDKHEGDHDEGTHEGITSSMQDNPLRGSFRITFINLSNFDEVVKVRNRIDSITVLDENGIEHDAVATEDIKDYAELYENVMSIKNALYIAGLWLMVIFLIISLFVIMNTIKLGVFARRNEITFMRLCGATKSFIRMPFIVEGVVIGTISAAISFGIEFYLYEYLLKGIVQSATGTSGVAAITAGDFWSDYALLVGIGFLAIGLFAGIVSSSISLKKYLKA